MSIFRMLADAIMIALALNLTILALVFSSLFSSIIAQNYGSELFSLGIIGKLAISCVKFGPPIIVLGTGFYFAWKFDRKMEQAERRIAEGRRSI